MVRSNRQKHWESVVNRCAIGHDQWNQHHENPSQRTRDDALANGLVAVGNFVAQHGDDAFLAVRDGQQCVRDDTAVHHDRLSGFEEKF